MCYTRLFRLYGVYIYQALQATWCVIPDSLGCMVCVYTRHSQCSLQHRASHIPDTVAYMVCNTRLFRLYGVCIYQALQATWCVIPDSLGCMVCVYIPGTVGCMVCNVWCVYIPGTVGYMVCYIRLFRLYGVYIPDTVGFMVCYTSLLGCMVCIYQTL